MQNPQTQSPPIEIRELAPEDAAALAQIDRSEQIESICRIENGREVWTATGHECPSWNEEQLAELQSRFRRELEAGGAAFGAYDGERLAGFGVLGHRWIGPRADTLQVDLMYVSRPYRRIGIGSRLMGVLSEEAAARGAAALYISSTETSSAVGFYRSFGSVNTDRPDPELFALEPLDIHMVRPLKPHSPLKGSARNVRHEP
ncbi:GNAT family N-acetyltransferase [Saccharibacillus alkalitolerans]|uniref:GNAT family N-acetyltransferase n=1 Tax=Saccharibacillus alkalitolerans TaxID=2705290 RepID=A0ABX0F9I6_9BACL|nr:GNAT family N-acetyltransferase [Saccharibacillus alkalitolerans]NGZ76684.1 GNAT family N-acetyltransferase [Saccharibacillus alkalitolerans]